MGIVAVKGMYWPEPSAGSAFVAMLLDALNEKAGMIFDVPETGDITASGFTVSAMVTAGSARVRLETVDPATGFPTGTLVHPNAVVAVPITRIGWYTVVYPGPVPVVQNTPYATVIEWASGNFSVGRLTVPANSNFPYTVLQNTGAWAKSTVACVGGIRYADGHWPYINGVWPVSSVGTQAGVAGSATSEEGGNRFKMPFGCRVEGIWWGAGTNVGEPKPILYAEDAATILAEGPQWPPYVHSATTNIIRFIPFFQPITLEKDQIVYAFIRAMTPASVALRTIVYDHALEGALQGGASSDRYWRGTNGNLNTLVDSRMALGFLINGVYDGVPDKKYMKNAAGLLVPIG